MDCTEAGTFLRSVTTSERKQEAYCHIIACYIEFRAAALLCCNFEICCVRFFQFAENFSFLDNWYDLFMIF